MQEFQLLLHCARSRPDVESVRDLVSKDVDWEIFLRLAAQNCVRPILLQTLKSACWNAIPQRVQSELTVFNKANVQKNLFFTGELLHLLDSFRQKAIPLVVFKGPVLALSVYGHISLREFSDLDIIVNETDLSKAEDILIDRGYQADFPDRDYRSAFLSYQGQYAFRHSNTGVSVDLHWQLSGKGEAFPLHSAEIWSRLEQVVIAGRMIPTLTRDDLALFLAAHGTKEGWRSLIWVCDFAELLRRYQDMDWLAIFERAERVRCSRPLLLAILLADRLLDAPAPPELLRKARNDLTLRALVEAAKLRMLRTGTKGELTEFLDGLDAYDHLRHKLWRVAALVTTRTVGDYQSMPLPRPLWGIYYFTRPFRLAGKVAAWILSRKAYLNAAE